MQNHLLRSEFGTFEFESWRGSGRTGYGRCRLVSLVIRRDIHSLFWIYSVYKKNKHLKALWKGNISRTKTYPNWTMWLFEDSTRFLKEGVPVKVTCMIKSRANRHYLTKIHACFKVISKTLPAWIINFFLSRSAFLAAACRCNRNRFSAGFDFIFSRAIRFRRASLAL